MDASSTKHLHIEFKNVAVENRTKSLKEGRPIFDQQEQVHIKFVGDTRKELVAPAHEKCIRDPATNLWVSYAQLYHRHYEAFKSGEAAIGEGTPISELPFLTEARRAELRALHIHTAEGLAQLEGANLSRLGMFGRELKEQAKNYIERAKETALESRLSAENAALKAQLEALTLQVHAMQPVPTPGPMTLPGAEPAGDDEQASSIFSGWEDSVLRVFIKERTGAAPKGQPSHATLVRLAEEANAKEAA
ncbi:hypothetical protein G5V57_18720 [Nordella sp. HKS 07]|uniref:hypothetical protein n=1 Tax=Nordella sp. HKS 07 TaxID=2712222 RepID=UPI0013E1214D|nr:hypothetical protein [Nordella sp. HKS 07]QIG49566.1 hypothetical protein G5V57_18720 [Nordella sp. HKS 07]